MNPHGYTASLSRTPATNSLPKQAVLGTRALWRIVEDAPDTTTTAPSANNTTFPLPRPKPRAFAIQLAQNNKLCLTTTRFSQPDSGPELPYYLRKANANTTTPAIPDKQPLWLAVCGSGIVPDINDGFRERPLQQTWLMEGFAVAVEARKYPTGEQTTEAGEQTTEEQEQTTEQEEETTEEEEEETTEEEEEEEETTAPSV